jgi:hypothetical protein
MSPQRRASRTMFCLVSLFAAAVLIAFPYSSIFRSGAHSNMSLAASLNGPAAPQTTSEADHSLAQNDPQRARIAQVIVRDVRHAEAMRRAHSHPDIRPTPSITPTTHPVTVVPVAQGDPQQIAEGMLASYGWPTAQFSCLQPLWNRESGWNVYASNPESGAYGIPQALPGSKMAAAGPDWQTNAATQIRWGMLYIKGTYETPCAAWAHEQRYGWY